MPTSVLVNGKRRYKPGIQASVDASALGGRTTSVGNLAIVGAFPQLEAYKPQKYRTAQQLSALDLTDPVLQRLARIAFSPTAADDRVGGPDSVTLVSAQTTSQAKYEFVDSNNNKSCILKSKLWGFKGNSIYVQLKSNIASDASYLDVILQGMGKSETYTKVGTGTVVTFKCTCDEIIGANGDTSTITVDNTSLTWSWLKKLQEASGVTHTFTGNHLIIDNGVVTLKALSASTFNTNQILLTVTGVSDAGAAVTGWCRLGDGAAGFLLGDTASTQATPPGGGGVWDGTGATGGAAVKFSRIDTVTWTKRDGVGGAYNGLAPAILGNAFAQTLAPSNTFTYVLDIINYINNFSGKGWAATSAYPPVGAIPAADLDKQTAADTLAAGGARFHADLWALEQALAASVLVTFSRSTGAGNGMTMPSPWNLANGTKVEVNLLGGTETAISSVATSYAAALVPLEAQDIQVVASMSTDLDAASALITHCKNAAVAESERNAYFGCPANTPLSSSDGTDILAAYTGKLNSRHLSVCAQQIQMVHPLTGAKEWLDPQYFAVLAAAMQCGVGVGVPLTFKRLGVLDVKQDSTTWTIGTSDDEVISKGIYATTSDKIGFKVLRSITCYLTDDNPAFSEVSANASVNYSIRNLRDNLQQRVGDPALMTPNQFRSVVISILRKQVENQFVYAIPEDEVVIAKEADKYSIDYGLVPVFPFDFGLVRAHVKGS